MSNTKLDRIYNLCESYGMEIVSFGLSPNANGFCFEASEETPEKAKSQLSRLLDSLNKEEETALREEIFG